MSDMAIALTKDEADLIGVYVTTALHPSEAVSRLSGRDPRTFLSDEWNIAESQIDAVLANVAKSVLHKLRLAEDASE